MSAIICVGWNSFVRPFHTGTPAYCGQAPPRWTGRSRGTRCRRNMRAEHACRVLDGFLLAHLGAAGIQVGARPCPSPCRHLERAACARGGLLEQQDDVLALRGNDAGFPSFSGPSNCCDSSDEIADFVRREVQQLQEVASAQASGHRSRSFHRISKAPRSRAGRSTCLRPVYRPPSFPAEQDVRIGGLAAEKAEPTTWRCAA